MYIHSKYIYISLTAMLPLKFGEDNERTIDELRNFFFQNFTKVFLAKTISLRLFKNNRSSS